MQYFPLKIKNQQQNYVYNKGLKGICNCLIHGTFDLKERLIFVGRV